jgi:hypothetical protein
VRREIDRALLAHLLDGSNRAYPDGDPETREKVRKEHLEYTRESDLLDALPQPDAVAIGSYNIDIRSRIARWSRAASTR